MPLELTPVTDPQIIRNLIIEDENLIISNLKATKIQCLGMGNLEEMAKSTREGVTKH